MLSRGTSKKASAPVEVIPIAEVRRVEAVAKEDVQPLACQAPLAGLRGQPPDEPLRGEIEVRLEPGATGRAESGEVLTVQKVAGDFDDALSARASHRGTADGYASAAVLDRAEDSRCHRHR